MAISFENNLNYVIQLLPDFSLFITLLLALLADKLLGEAKHFHYLVGFGRLANYLEAVLNNPLQQGKCNTPSDKSIGITKLKGIFAWLILVLPVPLFCMFFFEHLAWYWKILLDAIIIYLAIGLKSLHQHAMQVYNPLKKGDLINARHFTGYLVSRETSNLTEKEMSRATIESVLENGHDSAIASLLYYLIGGAPLVILHRLANTLDAMWGYKTTRFLHFGYASARLDDLFGFISGKCCTLLYAIQGIYTGTFVKAISNAYKQGNQYKSHNGGWVIASGATIMQRSVGGTANYNGKETHSVELGIGPQVSTEDIPKSMEIVKRSSLFLLVLIFTFQLISYLYFS